ncbi:MAG: hypothetical protein ACYDCJ_12600 [Gammaproteobacteria bacterium]
MNYSLTFYEFRKLAALVECVCLCVLVALFVLLTKDIKTMYLLTWPAITLVVSGFMTFFQKNKAERTLEMAKVKFFNTTRSTIYLALPIGCTLAGLFELVLARNYEITVVTLVCVAGFLGRNAGSIVKTRFVLRGE